VLFFCSFLQDIDGVDDAANFTEVLEALSDIGLSPADIHALLCTLSGILWLGNLKVEPVHADDSSRIKIDAALSNAANMLGLREKDLAYAITHKKVHVALAVAVHRAWPLFSLLILHVVHV
jgi:myosin-5